MENPNKDQNRISDKTRLLLKFNYTSSFLSLLLFFFCLYVLHIESVIPYVFLGYSITNFINILAFKKHGHVTAMAIVTSLLSFISTLLITLYSGGINSPFVFILSIIVLAGYVSTSVLGKLYLYVILAVITVIYFLGLGDAKFVTNAIPFRSRDVFSLISLLFSVYLLGEIFGRNLLKTHHKLYKSKMEIEKRILEKETLLKEVHHRVKNNLQTVSSLLSLQSRNTEDAATKNLIQSSQNRVISMAMIHEMLYMRDDLSKIEYRPYVRELGEYLIKSLKGPKNNISLKIDIPDIKLGIDTAIPLGLLINETVTNALKYGIKDNSMGEVYIALKEDGDNGYLLQIGDNGVGFSDDVDFKKTNSLGLKLIHNLARQLKGSVLKDNSRNGTYYTIRFQDISKPFKSVA